LLYIHIPQKLTTYAGTVKQVLGVPFPCYYSLIRKQDQRVPLAIPERLRSGEWTSGMRVRVEGVFVEAEDAPRDRQFRVEGIEVLED